MTPVIILSDGYIANGAEPWKIPEIDKLPKIEVSHPTQFNGDDEFLPYKRDENLARPWALPGTPDLMHRVGGLEKEDGTGNVSYDPANHQHMVETRAKKVELVADFVEEAELEGSDTGTLVISWGGTYGACHTAVQTCLAEGMSVGHVHLRWVNPFPRNLESLIEQYDHIIVPELNTGQMSALIRQQFLVDVVGINKIQGKPFHVNEIVDGIKAATQEVVS
jgi:2-oxoglutarate ferredoxin oxidoreductase subunit alpha